ncbi:hypothetical protein QBC40DRAFT_255772 [Triangularia verruculosa]|uniref:Uncharacterized protein n=1 Tax=Triangularia verruculosa TaxID=2587418 RepID=A0AAN7ATH0_9PEZI|nr:hypothetical protein QBC40DRAFT_255772 [Triangularia verruculosa]
MAWGTPVHVEDRSGKPVFVRGGTGGKRQCHINDHAEIERLEQKVQDLEKDKSYYKSKASNLERDAAIWEGRANAALAHTGWSPDEHQQHQDRLDAFDRAVSQHATQDKEKQQQLDKLQKQLADGRQTRSSDLKAKESRLQELQTQLDKEKKAHQESEKMVEHWKSLREKDLATLKNKLAAAQKQHHDKLRHQALESKKSVDCLATNNQNLQTNLTLLGEAKCESEQALVDIRQKYRESQQCLQAAQYDIMNYQKLLQVSVSDRDDALRQLEGIKRDADAAKAEASSEIAQINSANQSLAEENCELSAFITELQHTENRLRDELGKLNGAANNQNGRQIHQAGQAVSSPANSKPSGEVGAASEGSLPGRIIQDGLEFLRDAWVYFCGQPLRLIWLALIWWTMQVVN